MIALRPVTGAVAAFALLGLTGCAADPAGPEALADPEPLTAMSFNVLCSFCDPTYDSWDQRLGYFDDLFGRYDPDILGLQETSLPGEVAQLQALLGGFDALYFDDGQQPAWPDALILYRTARFEAVESGFYWLSPTPDVPFSTGFANGAQLPRLVAWVHLRERSTRGEVLFATTHFDNNAPSQDLSAPVLLERTAPWADDLPVLVTGDFNSQTYDPAFETLTQGVDGAGFHFVDTQPLATEWRAVGDSETPPAYDLAERIDHLFVDGPHADGAAATWRWSVQDWAVDLRHYGANGLFPSDHRAMAATLQLLPVEP